MPHMWRHQSGFKLHRRNVFLNISGRMEGAESLRGSLICTSSLRNQIQIIYNGSRCLFMQLCCLNAKVFSFLCPLASNMCWQCSLKTGLPVWPPRNLWLMMNWRCLLLKPKCCWNAEVWSEFKRYENGHAQGFVFCFQWDVIVWMSCWPYMWPSSKTHGKWVQIPDVKWKTSKQLHHSKLAYHQTPSCFCCNSRFTCVLSVCTVCVCGSATAIFLRAVQHSRHYRESLVVC